MHGLSQILSIQLTGQSIDHTLELSKKSGYDKPVQFIRALLGHLHEQAGDKPFEIGDVVVRQHKAKPQP